MFGHVLEAYFKMFFIKKYNIIVLIFLYIFIGNINYKNNFLLDLIQFYNGFSSQSRHLQIEVSRLCGLSRTEIKHFY